MSHLLAIIFLILCFYSTLTYFEYVIKKELREARQMKIMALLSLFMTIAVWFLGG
ncbi:hypothetical protein MKX67_03325 [Cytobacillus sp. FSL W7-1323]|uniref:hypothetical protein n=1 Tax=Cytobacillus TaxID=2675230 RepID=UPI0012FDA4D1|nr:hypothetical protein [Cytobacillus kochii]